MEELTETAETETSYRHSRRYLFLLLAFGLFSGGVMAFLTILNPSRSTNLATFNGPTPVPDRISEGVQAPDFTGVTPDGDTYQLSDLRGRPIAVNFWATWCAPCRVEMPELQAAYEAHGGEGFVILAINAGDTPEATQAFIDELDLTFPSILDENGDIVDLYEIRVFPTTIWIDAEGIVRAENFGPLTSEMIDTYLNELATPYSADESASR